MSAPLRVPAASCAACDKPATTSCPSCGSWHFCGSACAALVNLVHEDLCGVDPTACYLPPLTLDEAKRAENLGSDTSFQLFRDLKLGKSPLAHAKRKGSGGVSWKSLIDPLTQPSSPQNEPERSSRIAFVRNRVSRSPLVQQLPDVSTSERPWLMVNFFHIKFGHPASFGRGDPNPFSTYNSFYRQILILDSLTVLAASGRPIAPTLTSGMVKTSLVRLDEAYKALRKPANLEVEIDGKTCCGMIAVMAGQAMGKIEAQALFAAYRFVD